jgi:hypothetical protein
MASARLAAMTSQFASVATREQRGTFEMKNLTKETRQARKELTYESFHNVCDVHFRDPFGPRYVNYHQ